MVPARCMRAAGPLLSLLAIVLLAAPGIVRACAIDNVPSLRADSVTAVLNTASPTPQAAVRWAPFVFTRRFSTAQAIHFSENMPELARTLPPDIVHGRWIWQLGDGTRLAGRTVTHRYARPGTYLLSVAVAVPRMRLPFIFDAALVRVASNN